MSLSTFPEGFLWGAATASYQIEGAANEDGRGSSVWDTFSHTPGKVAHGETGDVACDHYHRYAEDVALMSEIGLPNYRFSISWTRLFPQGQGARNQKGFDFYNRLIDELLRQGIEPCVTLFHWDYPQALEDLGGWTNPDARKWFGDYAEACFEAFGDRCKRWITLNEPWCHAYLGNATGVHAPGNKDLATCWKVGHGLLLGHGEAVRRFRALGQSGEIGLTTNHQWGIPLTDSEIDRKATDQYNAFSAGWFLDPVYHGDYPEYLKRTFDMPSFTAEESALVQEKTDFMGLNFYEGSFIQWSDTAFVNASTYKDPTMETTQMGWLSLPETLKQTLVLSQKVYNPPKIYITENGAAYDDVLENGRVHDQKRMSFLRDYIRAAREAISLGVNLRGYFVWSLLDNFEWAEGYRPTFGIVHVDYATQARTPKDSAWMMGEVARANGLDYAGATKV